MPNVGSPIVIALDYSSENEALAFVDKLDPSDCRLKIGKELFTTAGPKFVSNVQNKGFDVFLDLKFHDIPTTVAKAVRAAADLGVWMVNVHASGGSAMLEKAAEAIVDRGPEERPLLIAVTVLTSMSDWDLSGLGCQKTVVEQVEFLASMARNANLDGVVSSAQEANRIKVICGQQFLTVTPGIRPTASTTNDQSRVMTPIEAVENGADYLVIGRPVTQAENPMGVVKTILKEVCHQSNN